MRKTIIIMFCCLLSLSLTSAWAAESGSFGFGGSSGSGESDGGGSDHGGYSEDDSPDDLTDSINSSWMCVRWMVSGWCYEEYLFVTHYFPVAYITTPVKKDDSNDGDSSSSSSRDSSSSSSSGSASSTSSSGGTQTRVKRDGENMSMAWEAIVWQITDDERDDALEDWDSCLCEFTEGSGGSSTTSSDDSGSCDSYDSDSSDSGSSGGSSSGGSSGGGSSGGTSGGSSDREMWYNSSLDGNNWREGCRDLNKDSDSSGGSGGMSGNNPFASNSSYSINDCKSTPVPDFSSLMDESCLGAWGALYPRYTFTSGTTELISSMKIAYRAAHVASNTLSKMPHPVDKQGIMQQVDPRKTICMDVGANPLLVDFISGVKAKGQYSWIYWKKVGCCKSMDDISNCSGG